MKITHFFDKHEFVRSGENWYDLYNPRWLVLADSFRLQTGKCILSPHPRALGRRDDIIGGTGYDAHNIDKHGLVEAGDTFPYINELEGESLSMYKAFNIAKKIGFTGIGIYPEWTLNEKRRCGIHLDVRSGILPGNPTTWGYVDGKFVTIETAFNYLIDII